MTAMPVDPQSYLAQLQAMQMPQANFGTPSFGQRFGGFMDTFGGTMFPAQPGMDPAASQAAQRQALLTMGLGMMGAANRPGASVGSSLFEGFGRASQSYTGAMDNAFRNTLVKQEAERQEKREEREEKKAQQQERQSTAVTAGRLASGISAAKNDPMSYWNLVSGMPEVQSTLASYGIDPATITTPEQLQQVAQQFGAASQVGGPAMERPAGPFAKVNPSDYTQDSVAAFQRSGDFSVLKPLVKPGADPADKTFQRANVLRDEFATLNKDFGTIEAQYGNIRATAKSPSAAGDIALITSYMRMIDPASTVREGEFATAQNAGGVNDKVRAQYNALLTGERLSESQRSDFVNQARNIFDERKKVATKARKHYSMLAERAGVDPIDVVGAEEGEVEYTATGPNGERIVWRNGTWESL